MGANPKSAAFVGLQAERFELGKRHLRNQRLQQAWADRKNTPSPAVAHHRRPPWSSSSVRTRERGESCGHGQGSGSAVHWPSFNLKMAAPAFSRGLAVRPTHKPPSRAWATAQTGMADGGIPRAHGNRPAQTASGPRRPRSRDGPAGQGAIAKHSAKANPCWLSKTSTRPWV